MVTLVGGITLCQSHHPAKLRMVAALPAACRSDCSLDMLNSEKGCIKNGKHIWCTNNGGKRWQPQPVPSALDNDPYPRFQLVNKDMAWWLLRGKGPLFVTGDHGKNWLPMSWPYFDGGIGAAWLMSNSLTVWVGGGLYENSETPDAPNYAVRVNSDGGWSILRSIIFLSTDNGRSWTEQHMPNCSYSIDEIRFWDRLRGFAVGDVCFYYTRDGGVTWLVGTLRIDTYPDDYARRTNTTFLDKNNGWMSFSDKSLLRTVDGGINWQLVSRSHSFARSENSRALQFVTRLHGFGLSERSQLFETEDGGFHWHLVSTPFLVRGLSASHLGATWILSDTDLYTLAPE